MFCLCIQGSPRKDGNTSILIEEFASCVKELGAEAEVINVSEKNISPCIGCRVCEKEGVCPIEDDMQEVYRKLFKADLVVIGTPIFFYGPTAQLKALIDRAQLFWSRRYVFKLSDPGRLWRKGFMITLGATKGRNLFEGVNLIAKYFFDAIGAEYTGYLGYRKIEEKGDILKHKSAIFDIRRKAEELVTPFLKRKKVLFVGNKNLIKIAYAFTRLYFGNKVDAKIAEESPDKRIDPGLIEIMAEKEIDIAYLCSESMADATESWKPDLVISIGEAKDLQGNVEKWDFPKKDIKLLRDEIERKVKETFGF